MLNITLMSEYSFKECFMHMSEIHKFAVDGVVGVADSHNTFAHIQLEKESKKHGFKPIYGVRLNCLPDNSDQRTCNMQWIFIAKNVKGLKRIYELVQKSFENFYYIPKLKYSDLTDLENVVVIAPFRHEKADYVGCGQGYPDCNLRIAPPNAVAVVENSFPQIEDRSVYELLSGAHKDGDEDVKYHFSHEVYPQHIMSKAELIAEYTDYFEYAMANTHSVAAMCEHFELPKAKMVKWQGDHNLYQFFDYTKVENWTEEYEARLEREMELITAKDYTDYFLIVADMIKYAKRTMMVGPGRGSSGGSLVCYLMGITEVDPIKHGLIFERFIDINRTDLPDIDVDFPDVKRESVIDYLKAKYGNQNVRCLANINRLKAKSAINDFAKALRIPAYEVDKVKDVIIERNDGDTRANFCLADTFATTEAGKEFIEKYPNMCLVTRIEGHANHAGKHAAGILVSTDNLAAYGSINVRDDIIQMDKKDAEHLGLLKIDCLGLRTLSILEEVAQLLGKPFKWFNSIPLDDVDTFRMMTALRLNGVFQFEGNTLQNIVRRMGVNDFNDIVAITSLARPGALNSGGAGRYVKHSTGIDLPTFYSDVHRSIVGDTFGIVVYQEQMMNIVRLIGGLSWEETSHLRKAISKSLGNEYIAKFKEQFVTGAKENGYSDEAIDSLWNDIASSGQYAFNKAHAVAYGLVSYWTAFCKCHFPREFAVACLNNATDTEQTIRLLRDFVQNEHFDYIPVDPDRSSLSWSFDGNTLLGPLTNIKGIGDAKAKQIIKARQGKAALTPSLFKMLSDPKTDVDILFPAQHYFGFLYNDPLSAGLDTTPSVITDVEERGDYVILGKLLEKNLRNLNDKENIRKRNGEKVDGNPFYITFKLEDDTGIINCRIDKKLYLQIGKDVSDNGKINKTWYLLRGVIKSDYRIFDVTEIVDITKYYKVDI